MYAVWLGAGVTSLDPAPFEFGSLSLGEQAAAGGYRAKVQQAPPVPAAVEASAGALPTVSDPGSPQFGSFGL